MNKHEFWQEIDRLIKEFNASQTRLVARRELIRGKRALYRSIYVLPNPAKKAEQPDKGEQLDKWEWKNQMLGRFYQDRDAKVLLNSPSRNITVVLAGQNVGKAVCGLTDSFDHELGIAVAYAKAIGEPVPKSV